MMKKQVNKEHYQFEKYMRKPRWISTWHQIDEILSKNPKNVLEVGAGLGISKIILYHLKIDIHTVDIDADLQPDYVASVSALPIEDNTYDCVCAFQVLEHLSYKDSIKAFGEMVRVSKAYIIISLPDSKVLWNYSFHIPKIGKISFKIAKPAFRKKVHKFDGQHHWEINKKGYPLQKIISDFTALGVDLIKTYRVDENQYHRFFIFRKVK